MMDAATGEIDYEQNKMIMREVAQQDGKLVSPIDLSLEVTTPLYLERLKWVNFDDLPSLMKLTNTGATVIISGKWATQRPHLAAGPLDNSYVFSQIHFHWGSSEHEGSEHTINGICYPMEIHVVFYKTRYLTQEAALRKDDGIAIVVYLVKLQNKTTESLRWLTTQLGRVVEPHTSTLLPPSPLSSLLVPFSRDYLLYWGSLATMRCAHTMLWLVCRAALGITVEDLNLFRNLLNARKEAINKNFRGSNTSDGRSVFHVNPSSEKKHLLLPGVVDPPGQSMIVNYTRMPELDYSQAVKIFCKGDFSGNESTKSEHSVKTFASSRKDFYFCCEGSDHESQNGDCRPSSTRITRDGVLTSIRNQKKRDVAERKLTEKERKKSLEITLGNNVGRSQDKLKSSGSNKSLTSRLKQPYIVRKSSEKGASVGKSIPPVICSEGNGQDNHLYFHSNKSQTTKDNKLHKPFKSKLPVMTNSPRPVLESSLAKYFKRPQSVQDKTRTYDKSPVTPNNRQVLSTTPKPVTPKTLIKNNGSEIKPTRLQQQCSGLL